MRVKVGLLSIASATNLFNVEKALNIAGAETYRLKEICDFKNVDKIVLPGVGSFKDMMNHIGGDKNLLSEEIKKKPTLGICLGMQICAKTGYEYGMTEGLGIIDGEVKKIEVNAKTPHMGWNQIIRLKDSRLFNKIPEDSKFYFMHSYELVNYNNVVALTEYQKHQFVSVIEKDNLFGVQFHPEKSRETGIQLLRNFIEL